MWRRSLRKGVGSSGIWFVADQPVKCSHWNKLSRNSDLV